MKTLQEALIRALAEIDQSEAFSGRSEELADAVSNMLPELADSVAESMLMTIRKNASTDLEEDRRTRLQFEGRLYRRWQRPLDLLDLFVSIAIEAGSGFNGRVRDSGDVLGDAVFESLSRLHARACQTSSAILALLKSGYADDAHARWRSLHEMAAVCQFISREGRSVAEKYLLHEVIEQHKLAMRFQEFASRINEEPPSQDQLDNLKERRDALIACYGKEFKEDYGWAASTVRKERPSISDIEQHIDMEHWRPYYRMASDNVHANAHGTYWKLGLNPDNEKVLLAGPSHMGLADPGHSTAISLNLITTLFLSHKPNFDDVVATKILGALVKEVGEAFLKVHREVEEPETAITRKMP